jgi:hypothetical protein
LELAIPNLPEAREYLMVELTNALESHIRYMVSFYASPADHAQYAISTLGAALTAHPPDVITVDWPNGMLDATPQVMLDERIPVTDTTKWALICDTVMALGGERYLTIGNFNLDGDSDTLRFNPNQPPIFSSPTTFAYYYIDDVFVYAIDSVPSNVGIKEQEALGFEVYPNPVKDVLRFRVVGTSHSTGSGQETSLRVTVRVLDAVGRPSIHHPPVADGTQDDRTSDLGGLPSGIYFLELTDIEGGKAVRKFVKE